MTNTMEAQIIALCLLFCRIGGCMMFAPGISSQRVPMNIRLFMAISVAGALSPMLLEDLQRALASIPRQDWTELILHETLIGILIGLMARCFFLALQFSATAISNFIGLSGIPGIPLEEADTGSPLATLVSSASIAIIFAMGLHLELLKALADSYTVLPLQGVLTAQMLVSNLLHALGETWLLALRLSGPFLLYGVIVNFALGMGNRFAQQISMYHATTGAVMLGGFLLLYLIWVDWMAMFTDSYRSWLMRGGF